MKSKAVLLALFTVLIITTGIAWAAEDTSNDSQPPVVEATQVETDNQTAAELLASMTADKTEATAGGCCAADCWTYWEMCMTDCGADAACRQACRVDRRNCTSSC